MRHVVTASEMRLIDGKTIEEVGIPGLLLMENAGLGIVRLVGDVLATIGPDRVHIVCGKGKNGGDGMVVARHLVNRSIPVSVYLAGEKKALRGDALTNLTMLEGFKIPVQEIRNLADLPPEPEGSLLIDALLGTGVTGQVSGLYAGLIDWMNQLSMPVMSVDIPSGIHCDDGSICGTCVHANWTATMAELKRGLVLPPGREMAGQVTLVDIGAPPFVAESIPVHTYQVEASDVRFVLPERNPSAHKGDFGKLLILAGSLGMTGAASLASAASLRAGAGLAVLGIPQSLNAILESKLTEVMTRPLPETPEGSLSLEAEKAIDELLEWADVLAIGPGLSTHPETAELVRRIVAKTKLPFVLDADGVNAFTGKRSLLENGDTNRILTPHFGELSRVIGVPIETIASQRIEIAREWAHRFGSILVIKGAPTVIGYPDGDVIINISGNAGMATAGSGDVLTGAIAGLLAQGANAQDAAVCGVYLHGMAGDIAREQYGERSLIAGDLLGTIGEAFCRLVEEV